MDRIEKVKELLGTQVRVIVCVGEEKADDLLRLSGVKSPNLLAEEAIDKAFLKCERIQNQFSRFRRGNELAYLNERLGQWVKVSEEFYNLLKFAHFLNEFSDGTFDISVKGILESWGYDENYSFKEAGEGKLGKLYLRENFEVKITAPVELGAIGKGYTVDQMIKYLENFDNFCVNAGGDIYARGCEVDGKPWKVVFEHPVNKDEAIGFVNVDDLALASSSPSRRSWSDKHHLVDALKKSPASEMLAVYTQAKSLMMADGFSTALFVMGYEKAKACLEDLPVEAMLVGSDGEISVSEGFKGQLFLSEQEI